MMNVKTYKDRFIEFYGIVHVEDWRCKVYRITYQEKFISDITLDHAIKEMRDWIKFPNESGLEIYKVGFLIVHEGIDGVWILFYWWTGGEMLGSKVFFVSYDSPTSINLSPHPVSLVCVWELEVIQHERSAWIKHVLQDNPSMGNYLSDFHVNDVNHKGG